MLKDSKRLRNVKVKRLIKKEKNKSGVPVGKEQHLVYRPVQKKQGDPATSNSNPFSKLLNMDEGGNPIDLSQMEYQQVLRPIEQQMSGVGPDKDKLDQEIEEDLSDVEVEKTGMASFMTSDAAGYPKVSKEASTPGKTVVNV